MTGSTNFYRYINKPIAMLAAVLVVSFTMATLSAQRVSAAPHSPLTVRDDNCYSTLNLLQGLPGFQFGLVNAVVNVPIYDWDQRTPSAAFDVAHDFAHDTRFNLARNSVAPPVGYANKFNFTVTPVPNIRWVADYLAKQLPYDIGLLASIVTGNNPVPEPNPHIANPFIYQQGSIILPSGIPRFQVFNKNSQPDMNSDAYNAVDGIGQYGNPIEDNPEIAEGAQQYIDPDTGLISDEYQTANQSGVDDLVSGPLGFASNSYWVNGDNPADNCYETIFAANKVPAYAFSVVGAGFPITIPGTFYSIFTMLMGKGPSFDGMTIYPPSLNGKDMLDCFGRGITPTMVLTPHRMGDPPRDIEELIWFGISWVADYAIVLPRFAWAGWFAPVLAGIAMLSPSNWYMRRLPTPHTRYINYYNGFSFAFTLSKRDIELPDHLKNRAIDFGKSKWFYVNLYALLHPNPNGHSDSQNAHSFNPNFYLKLKKSYELTTEVSIDGSLDRPDPKLDGREVRVDVGVHKTGFDEGSSRSNPYDRDANDKGGPTYQARDNKMHVFSKARVYRIKLKPGVSANAIDVDMLKDPGNPENRYFGHITGQDPCSILVDRLTNGDDAHARIPKHRDTTANGGLPEYDPAEVECGIAPGTGNPIDITLTENETDEQLLSNYIEKIPAETPPGTKICFAVWLNNYGNDVKYENQRWWNEADGRIYNYNENYNADPDKSYLSRAKCIISGYKPSFQVRGGDLMVGEGIFTGTNTKDYLASPDPTDKRTYGSWSEYGAFAGGVIKHIGSGAVYRLGMPQSLVEHGYLTFSNNRDSSNDPQYGNYNGANSSDKINDGFDKVAAQFTSTSGTAEPITENTVDLSSLDSGTYLLNQGPVDITVSAPNNELAVDRSIVLLAQDDTIVNFRTNVRTPNEYESIGQISQLVIAPASTSDGYYVNIESDVTRVDSWLINPNGEINTCWISDLAADGSDDYRLTPRSVSECDNTLYVNGPVAASTIYLRRSGGKDQNTNPLIVDQSVPAETFTLRPDAYLWAATHVNDANKKYVTTNVIDLPPRY